MEFSDYMSSGAVGVAGVLSWIVKSIFAQHKETKAEIALIKEKSQADINQLNAEIGKHELTKQDVARLKEDRDKFEAQVFKKFSSINTNHDKQVEVNSEFKQLFASINTKLDILLERNDKKK